MALPAPNDVAELFGMLFGTTVEVTEVERDPGTHWLALCMFTTPENEPIAVVGADIPTIAAQGARSPATRSRTSRRRSTGAASTASCGRTSPRWPTS